MPANLRQILEAHNVTRHVIIPAEIDTLLRSLFITEPSEADIPQSLIGPLSGKMKGGADRSLLGFSGLNIDPMGAEAGFTLNLVKEPSCAIDLNYDSIFTLLVDLKGVTIQDDGDKKVLQAINLDSRGTLKGVVLLRIARSATTPATLRLLRPDAENAVLTMACDPLVFLFDVELGSPIGIDART